uniref:Uncharacterized protein n=1 Tax=Marseillevirus sp. TaxID=2809551 RepID=A0AA96J0F5_9VIRU|nr:hypothetical protein MarFTMF_046 [Marseillevirus sp.]
MGVSFSRLFSLWEEQTPEKDIELGEIFEDEENFEEQTQKYF